MMSSSKTQVSVLNFNQKTFNFDYGTFCNLHVNHVDLTNLSTCFCYRLKDGELVPDVIPTPPSACDRSIHLLCDIAGASDNGESQGFWPQRSPHILQLRCGGSLTLHVLWSESFVSIDVQSWHLYICITPVFLVLLSSFVKNRAVTQDIGSLVKCTRSWNFLKPDCLKVKFVM